MDKVVKERWLIEARELYAELSDIDFTLKYYHEWDKETPNLRNRRLRKAELEKRIRKIMSKVEGAE